MYTYKIRNHNIYAKDLLVCKNKQAEKPKQSMKQNISKIPLWIGVC